MLTDADLARIAGHSDLSDDLAELLRAYRLWRDAPEGFVIGQSGPDNFFTQHAGAIVQMENPAAIKGQRVRLVADTTGGE